MGPKIRISFKLSIYKVEIGKLELNSEYLSYFIRGATAAAVPATLQLHFSTKTNCIDTCTPHRSHILTEVPEWRYQGLVGIGGGWTS